MIEISSTTNSKYKYIKSLKQKKQRIKMGEYTVEGSKSVHDALDSDCDITCIVVSASFYKNEAFDYRGSDIYVIDDNIFGGLCDTETPQGILAVIEIQEHHLTVKKNGIYIFCDCVTDPGNLGTIIRTADAAGMDGVLLSDGCVDIYNPKTVRASMGSFFNMPVYNLHDLSVMKRSGYHILCGALGGVTVDYTDVDMTLPTVIVVGNEANGVSEEIVAQSDICVKIPIIGKAESLNVAIAAAILMYEANRQRK